MIHQSPSWAYIQTKLSFKKILAPFMSTAALFTIAKTCKQPKCPSADEWIKKMWYTYTTSAIQKNKKCHLMQQEILILKEVSQKKKVLSYDITFYVESKIRHR